MPKPIKFTYEKKKPFRDASLFVILCEGRSREREYFQFFDGMSSRVKLIPVINERGSAPPLLLEAAIAKEAELEVKADKDSVWFVIDTDSWREHLHKIRQECAERQHWSVVQSNPCFEVWLFLHAKAQLPDITKIDKCSYWKSYLPLVIQGGFNSDTHPISIETAIANAKNLYQSTGYFPNPGCTQLWKLGEALLPLIKKDIDLLRHRFQTPVVIG